MTRPLLAVATFLALASPAYAGVKLQEREAKSKTMLVASDEVDKLRDTTTSLIGFNVTGCTRKTRVKFVCRYTLELRTPPTYEIGRTCDRRVTVTKTKKGMLRATTAKEPCEAA